MRREPPQPQCPQSDELAKPLCGTAQNLRAKILWLGLNFDQAAGEPAMLPGSMAAENLELSDIGFLYLIGLAETVRCQGFVNNDGYQREQHASCERPDWCPGAWPGKSAPRKMPVDVNLGLELWLRPARPKLTAGLEAER